MRTVCLVPLVLGSASCFVVTARTIHHAPALSARRLPRYTESLAVSSLKRERGRQPLGPLARSAATIGAIIITALASPQSALAKGGGRGGGRSSGRSSSSISRSHSRSSSRSVGGSSTAESLVYVGVYCGLSLMNKFQSGGEEDEDRRARTRRDQQATRALMDRLRLENDWPHPDADSRAIRVPASGKYVGRSAEDDRGDQSVETHLRFEADGSVRGWGNDGADGRYVIKEGHWIGRVVFDKSDGHVDGRVAWIETYDDGFEVALRGQVLENGVIRGLWASDRGVSGSVQLVHEL